MNWRWRFLRKQDAAELVDTLRRTTELLDAAWSPGVTPTDHWRKERDDVLSLAREQVRRYDPKAQTDQAITLDPKSEER